MAVAAETFFGKPLELRRDHKALYEELREYFKLDPASWVAAADR